MSFFFDRWFKFLLSALVFLFFLITFSLITIKDAYVQPPPTAPPPYTDSAHGNSTTGVSGHLSGYGTGNCAHCHEQHASVGGAEPTPQDGAPDNYLLFTEWSNDYYNAFCTGQCHKALGLGGDDIASQYAKTSHHPTTGIHTPDEDLPADFAAGATRHGYCIDCHNPHVAKNTLHSAGTNAASGPILNVSGVSVSNPAAWITPTSYTFISESDGIDYEYQLCFKCHSSWTTQPTGQADTAKEFNPANASYHPVEAGLNSGSSALSTTQLSAPWNVNVGTQTMYCSDCHGDDAASPPVGPHGSGIDNILKGYWPKNSSGTLWNFANLTTDCLCKNCHPIYDGTYVKNEAHSGNSSGLTFDRHSTGYECVQCHVGLPHGYHYSAATMQGRLIAHANDSAPYNYDGLAEVTYFTKQSPNSYDDSDCQVAACSTRRH